jgi:hypothetical protein
VPLTNSVGDKIPYSENKGHSIFAIESLMYLSMLGHPNQRMNQSTNENQVEYKHISKIKQLLHSFKGYILLKLT